MILRLAGTQADPMLGREVVEGREVVSIAVESLDRRLLASRVEPAGELVPAQLALTPARRIPDLFQRPAATRPPRV